MALLTIRQGWAIRLDVALGFAAVGFAGTVLLAKRRGDDSADPEGRSA